MSITAIKQGPREFVRNLHGANFHEAAKRRSMSVRQLLKEEFGEDSRKEGISPLGLLMWQNDLVPFTDEVDGVRASTYEEFKDLGDGGMFIMLEHLRGLADQAAHPALAAARRASEAEEAGEGALERVIGRSGATGPIETRSSIFGASDQPYGTPFAPYYFDPTVHYPQIAPQIPLETVVARSVGITGGAMQAFFVSDTAASRRMTRVAQGASIPLTKITGSNHTISLKKYGRGIELTYEVLRWTPIDLIGLLVQRIAIQTVADQISAAMDIAVNGDGNAATAATNYNLTTLDSTTTANNLTVAAWLSFKLKFLNPYVLTTVLGNEAAILKLQLLNVGSANIPLSFLSGPMGGQGLGGMNIINPQLREPVAVGVSADAPTGVIIGLDARFALAHITETGGDIQEADRFIQRQTEALYISYLDAFMTLDPLAIKTLTLSA